MANSSPHPPLPSPTGLLRRRRILSVVRFLHTPMNRQVCCHSTELIVCISLSLCLPSTSHLHHVMHSSLFHYAYVCSSSCTPCCFHLMQPPPPPPGEPILWYERCRIKHLLTQQYLAVERRDGQCVLTLKEEKAVTVSELDQDTCTTFRLFPVISGEDEIKYGTYARINHPQTRTWLHAGKGGW